ncbi:predicted protein [Uncinocarpus reesii 1704]|uniref:Uncharacterized protein n=1 Tax=Uncinocarpus reesii (strain UAMH 1704) TaxID=336963 RepID=C4JQS9_UNCRE|nr:uncharacterized protein UREG_03411 [Uncinocarpus reesii 1704]EEP78565.1 predicted protein [Uncinocarpus reesii 1704]
MAFSSAMFSAEAERILENAKERLTHMEGNLSKARKSIGLCLSATSTTANATKANCYPKATLEVGRRAHSSLAGTLLHRQFSDDFNNSNLRDVQESNNSSNYSGSPGRPPETEVKHYRPFSALASASGCTTETVRTGPSDWGDLNRDHERSHRFSTSLHHPHLSALTTKDCREPFSARSQPITLTSKARLADRGERLAFLEDFNNPYASNPPSRSQSQFEIRGLQDQMHGLRTKLSTLKDKTLEDQTRRHSLQNFAESGCYFATPGSPQEFSEQPTGGEVARCNAGTDHEQEDPALLHVSEKNKNCQPESAYDDALSPDEFQQVDPDDFAGTISPRSWVYTKKTEKVRELVPILPVVETLPHEDRVDAFDYERFILHSALGNYDGSKSCRQSYSSTESRETTKPHPHDSDYPDYETAKYYSSSNSSSPVSTMVTTLGTSTEGSDPDDSEQHRSDDISPPPYWKWENTDFKMIEEDMPPRTRLSSITCNRSPFPDLEKHSETDTRTEINSASADISKTNNPRSTAPAADGTFFLLKSLLEHTADRPNCEIQNMLFHEDAKLMRLVFHSLGRVGLQLGSASAASKAHCDEATASLLRNRLDTALRVLEGELDI